MFVYFTVSNCLSALRQTLPRDAAMLVFCRWYSQRNLPGAATNSQLEWRQFVICLLGILGYDSAGALRPLMAASESHAVNLSPSLQSKKPRLLDHSTDAVRMFSCGVDIRVQLRLSQLTVYQ
jgi:hypothetical protein